MRPAVESLASAFVLVFVAELGDKTQLVALGLGAQFRLLPVVVGVLLAYAASMLLSVVVGAGLGAALPERAIAITGGLAFLGFAMWVLRAGEDHQPDPREGERSADPAVQRSVVLSVAAAMFLAELGDKTMIAAATLAARSDNAVLTWVGGFAGIAVAGLVGVAIGSAVGARLPERALRVGSALLFAIFGAVLLATAW